MVTFNALAYGLKSAFEVWSKGGNPSTEGSRWKWTSSDMKYIYKLWIYHCYVSLLECPPYFCTDQNPAIFGFKRSYIAYTLLTALWTWLINSLKSSWPSWATCVAIGRSESSCACYSWGLDNATASGTLGSPFSPHQKAMYSELCVKREDSFASLSKDEALVGRLKESRLQHDPQFWELALIRQAHSHFPPQP